METKNVIEIREIKLEEKTKAWGHPQDELGDDKTRCWGPCDPAPSTEVAALDEALNWAVVATLTREELEELEIT